jgi:hypothetical protein
MQACLGSQPTATPMNIAALTMLGVYVVLLLAIRPFGELEDMVRAHIHGLFFWKAILRIEPPKRHSTPLRAAGSYPAHPWSHRTCQKGRGPQASWFCFVCLFAPARRANPQFYFDLRCRLERVPDEVPLEETNPFRSTPNDVSV